MNKPRRLNIRRYAARLIDITEYFASFPEVVMADKIGVTELNETLFNSIPNS